MSNDDGSPRSIAIPIALGLGWLVPGLGHIVAGHRARGLILLITMLVTFWTGVALGGVRSTVNPAEHNLWFIAQMGAGGHALVAWMGSRTVSAAASVPEGAVVPPTWRAADLALHYTGVTGLLNVLVLLDLVARGDRSWARSGARGPARGAVT